MKHTLLFLFVFTILCNVLKAQDSSLLSMLSDSMQANEQPMGVKGTFKGLYIINMKTVESSAAGRFKLSHYAPLWQVKRWRL